MINSSKSGVNSELIHVSNKPESNHTWPIAVLLENVHYYMENGFMVFTEDYHLARGSCCGNTCRHCPYEHCNVRKKE